MFDRRRIRKTGTLAQALVVSVEDRSRFAGTGPHDYEHVLRVRATDREPFDAVVRHRFDLMERRPQPQELVQVRYDPQTQETVLVLEGDPRYDLDAMNARTAAIRAGLPEAARDGSLPGTAGPGWVQPARSLDPLSRLEGLARLHAAGVLTDEEFAVQKAKILAEA
jgi:hypothetical protein